VTSEAGGQRSGVAQPRSSSQPGGAGAVNPKDKDPLLFIAKVDYRGYAIKIARRGQEIRLLVHAPGKVFAAQMITDALANYENALQQARQAIDDMIEAEES
jgi:hypothetical protein